MRITIILILILFSQLGHGQTGLDTVSVDTTLLPVKFELISTYHGGKIILRWAPSTVDAFIRTIAQPFMIERFDLTPDTGKVIISSRKETILRPWGEKEFQPYMDQDEPFVLTAAQVMYGETQTVDAGFATAYEDVINRYGLALLAADMDVDASRALAWRYEDSEVEEGKRYFYRVQLLDTSIVAKPFYKSELASAPEWPTPVISSVIEEEGNIGLFWSRQDYREVYTGFHIERSADGEQFERLTTSPIVYARSDDYAGEMITYRDSIDNYDPYYYRLIGITPFGFETIPSTSILAMARDRTPPQSPMNVYIDTDQNTGAAHISWELPDDPEIAAVEVFRSLQFDVTGCIDLR